MIPMRTRCSLLSLILLSLFVVPASAQIPPLEDYGSGTRYVIAFPDTTSNIFDSRYPNNRFRDGWYVFLYSSVGNNRVKILGGGGSGTNLTLQAGRFQVQEITSNPVVTRINTIESNTLTIISDYPIVVYCFCAQRQGMEAWTPIPVDMWGAHYNVAAIPGETVGDIGPATPSTIPYVRKGAPSEILVMAAYDSTVVTIAPKSSQRLVGVPTATVVVRLNAGQCYQVQSVVDTSALATGQVDLGGVVVSATRPVGVISGNTRALVRQDHAGITKNACRNMLIEWLSPTDELGTELVFMPSWDGHRPGVDSPNERGSEYIRVYNPKSHDVTFYNLNPGGTTKYSYTVRPDTLRELEIPTAQAVYVKASEPMQGMMHSTSILQLVSRTPCRNGKDCETYDTWAPYMVEMTPREQWPGFAPYYAPNGPASPMQHYINVVTDTLSMGEIVDETGAVFPLTRRIAGTDLIWGSRAVVAGVDHYLYGRKGARFSGFVYGFYKGSEQFRPGGGAPAEYEEYNALSYGYPLAPLRRAQGAGDSLVIDSTRDCAGLSLGLRLVNPGPSGFRSISLDPASVVNATLVPVDPVSLTDVPGRTTVRVKIAPLNPLRDAGAKLIARDRTGKIWYVDYVYRAERLDADSTSVDFGQLTVGEVREAVVTYTNPLDREVEIREVKLGNNASGAPGTQAFEIISTEPPGPAGKPARPITLKKGETFTVHLRMKGDTVSELYGDSLKVVLGCVEIGTPVHGEVVEPLIMVNDLNFGTLIADPSGGSRKTMEMRVCSIGSGFVTFDSGAGPVLTWLDAGGLFSIPQSEIDELKTKKLGPNECFTLHVTLNPAQAGVYSVTARFFANTRDRKDTSAWSAEVITMSGVAGEDVPGYALGAITPNPSGGSTSIAYTLGASGRTTVTLHDGSGALVATLLEGSQGRGEHRVVWDASGMAAGIYYCRISSGTWSAVRPIVVR